MSKVEKPSVEGSVISHLKVKSVPALLLKLAGFFFNSPETCLTSSYHYKNFLTPYFLVF